MSARGRFVTADPVGPLLRQRVLVADDNTDAAEMIATLLGQVGCEVRTAGDGRTAIAEADALQPELVLLEG
jgi:two-component system OmpR family response regulator